MILLVIDVQDGLDDPRYGERNNPGCEGRIAMLLEAWRGSSHPVLYTQHFSTRPDSRLAPQDPGSRIKASVAPRSERVFTKTTNSAFKNGDFSAAMASSGTRDLVIAGIATDACVTATAREAKDIGYDVTIVADATATFSRRAADGSLFPSEVVHQVSLAALAASGMRVCTSEAIVRELTPEGGRP